MADYFMRTTGLKVPDEKASTIPDPTQQQMHPTSNSALLQQETPPAAGRPQRSILSRLDICGIRKLWKRSTGFALAVILVFFGAVHIAFNFLYHKPKFDQTSDFKAGMCSTSNTAVEERYQFRCVQSGCAACKHPSEPYTCNKLMGRVQFSTSNYSRVVQIYANTELLEGRMGACSYRPKITCKDESESIFTSVGAFEGKNYRCYYSPSDPLKVVLERNNIVSSPDYILPAVLVGSGIALAVLVQFLGHKFRCSSKAQMAKRSEEIQLESQAL